MPQVLAKFNPPRDRWDRAEDLRGTLMGALGARHLTSRLQTQQLAEATVYVQACNDR
jgi:hypothetical protein